MNAATNRSTGSRYRVCGSSDLHDASIPHHGDPLAQRHRLRLVVGHVHGRHAEPGVQLGERRAHADAELRVQVRQRLVHEEGLRLPHDGATHGDALALAARELGGSSVEQLLQPQQAGDLLDATPDLRLLRAAHLQAVAEVLAHRHVRIEGVALEHHRDVAVARREVGHVPAADRHAARRDLLEPGDHPQQGRLAAAGRADENHELAVGDRQADVVDGHDIAVEDLRDVGELDRGHCFRDESIVGTAKSSRPVDHESRDKWY